MLLVDSIPIRLQLVEDATKTGKVVVRGEFARADVATENKRKYPGTIWEREFKKLAKPMSERKLFGELDHPTDGRTLLARVSHLITSLSLENGIVIGEAEVVDTQKGQDLKAILRAGGAVGVSSRGYGSTRPDDSGNEVVQEDYALMTFDFVAEPADNGAYPTVFQEQKETRMEGALVVESTASDAEKAAEWARRLGTAKAEEREATVVSLREEFATTLLARLGEMRTELESKVRTEMLSDPNMGTAKTALDAVKVALRPFLMPEDAKGALEAKDAELVRMRAQIQERDLRIKVLDEENSKLAAVAKEAGYKFYMERALTGDPDAALIRRFIGDVTVFESADALKVRLESVRGELKVKHLAEQKALDEKRAVIEEAEQARLADQARAQKSEAVLTKRMAQMESGLVKSLALNEALGARLYAERRLANHPQASKLRAMMEAVVPLTNDRVDEMIESFRRTSTVTVDEGEEIRTRVRRLTRGGHGSTPADEEEAGPLAEDKPANFMGTGTDIKTLRKLSGIPGGQGNRKEIAR